VTERVKVQVASAAAAGAGELGGLRASVELKAQQVVALTAELATSAAALRAMEAKLAELEVASLSQKDDRMRSMQDKCDGLVAQLRESESRLQQAEGRLKEADQRTGATESRLRTEVEQAEQLLTMAQNDVAELRLSRSELSQQLDDSRRSGSSQAAAERAKLQGELASAGQQAAEATSKLERYVKTQRSMVELLGEYRKTRCAPPKSAYWRVAKLQMCVNATPDLITCEAGTWTRTRMATSRSHPLAMR
jgi:chromosome segregation ATPase